MVLAAFQNKREGPGRKARQNRFKFKLVFIPGQVERFLRCVRQDKVKHYWVEDFCSFADVCLELQPSPAPQGSDFLF